MGTWSNLDGTAAGSPNFGRYHSNPTALLRLRGTPGRVCVRLQPLAPTSSLPQQLPAVNVSLYRCLHQRPQPPGRSRARGLTAPAAVGGGESSAEAELQAARAERRRLRAEPALLAGLAPTELPALQVALEGRQGALQNAPGETLKQQPPYRRNTPREGEKQPGTPKMAPGGTFPSSAATAI